MADPVARKVHLYGRVQGVFFRQWSVNHARRLGVAGWIRNLPDGSVEAYVTGEEQAVTAMIDCLRQGPNDARVEDVTVENAEPQPIDGFSVKL